MTYKTQQVKSCHLCTSMIKQDHVNLQDLCFDKFGLQDTLTPPYHLPMYHISVVQFLLCRFKHPEVSSKVRLVLRVR